MVGARSISTFSLAQVRVYPGVKRQSLILSAASFSVALIAPNYANAACPDSDVSQLAEAGHTPRWIAKHCEMAVEDVLTSLKEKTEPAGPAPVAADQQDFRHTLSSGQAASTCACWGSVSLWQRIPNNICRSGISIVVACQMPCPLNNAMACPIPCPGMGNMWYTVCG